MTTIFAMSRKAYGLMLLIGYFVGTCMCVRQGAVSSFVRMCENGDVNEIRAAIEEDNDFVLRTERDSGMNCLAISSKFGHAEAVRLLIKSGCSVRNRDEELRWTPLMWAARGDFVDIVRTLQRADPGGLDEALRDAAGRDHSGLARKLLQYGANPNARGTGGVTSLMKASMYNYATVVQILSDAGADPTIRNVDRISSLTIAARYGHYETVRIFLDSLAKNDSKLFALHSVRDGHGRTALHTACDNGNARVARLLLENGWSIDDENSDDGTPFTSLVRSACLDMMKRKRKSPAMDLIRHLLVDGGTQGTDDDDDVPNVNARNGHDLTPLMIASKFGHVEIAKMLMDAGADIHAIAKVSTDRSEYRTTTNALALAKGSPRRSEILVNLLSELGAEDPPNADLPFGLSGSFLVALFATIVLVAVFSFFRKTPHHEKSN